MSFLQVERTQVVSEDRSWMTGTHGTEVSANPNITLDLSLFDKAKHYPKGFLPSGLVVGKTDGGQFGPYDPAATDGRQTPKGLLFSSVAVKDGQARAAGALYWHGVVNPERLPIKAGSGAIDAAARESLSAIFFTD